MKESEKITLLFEEFINEESEKPAVNPKTGRAYRDSYVNDNDARQTYYAGFGVYGTDKYTHIFPHLGDKKLKLLVDGPRFIKEVCDAAGITKGRYTKGIKISIPKKKAMKFFRDRGFKKYKDEYEIEVTRPEHGVKIVADAIIAFKELKK